MNSAVIYVRSSTNNRACIATQIKNCTKFAQENNLHVAKTYIEIDSSYIQRERVIKGYRSQKFRNIIIYSMDRLSRHAGDLKVLMKTFEENTVSIFLSKENACPPMSSFQIGILEVMKNYETQIVEERELNRSALDGYFPA